MKEKEVVQVDIVEPKKATGEVVVSPKNALIGEDWKVSFERGMSFAIPFLLLYIADVVKGITTAMNNGTFIFDISYFIPKDLPGMMALYTLNRLWDILSRYRDKVTYKV